MTHKYKTVLIFGAGISKAYGFPLASELLPQIGGLRRNKAFRAYANTFMPHEADLSTFFEATSIDYHGTIDEFLRKNPRYIPIGLSAIAWLLLQHERSELELARVVTSRNSFYRILFDILKLDPELGPPTHDISIITLNYERSVEYWLNRMINLCVGEADKPQAIERLSALRIHHLHGSLGSLDDLPYSTPPTDAIMQNATAHLMTIYKRDRAFEESYETAIKMMHGAAMVYILGSSYDTTIYNGLFPNISNSLIFAQSRISRIYGTVIGTNPAMKERIAKVFGENNLIPANPNEQPVDFLPRMMAEFHDLVTQRSQA